jgi:hypothetical protein
MRPLPSALLGAGIGATLAAVLDPSSGRRRRAFVQDKLVHMARRGSVVATRAGRDLAHRTKGVLATARQLGRRSAVDDVIVAERVRATIGHFVSPPRAVQVIADRGTVLLEGRIPSSELEALLSAVEGVPGVLYVESRLEAGDASAQSSRPRRSRRWSRRAGAWAAVGGVGVLAVAVVARALAEAEAARVPPE